MATSIKKTTKPVTKVVDETAVTEVIENATEETTQEVSKPARKKFNADDEIPCVSLFAGEFLIEGVRSKDLYTFADIDDLQYIRYDDLDYMIKRKTPTIFEPYIIIKDEDLLQNHPEIAKLYGKLYSSADLKAIMKLSPEAIKSKVATLPSGAVEALETIVMTEVDRGRFDSIGRLRAFDEVFHTSMVAKVTGM